MRIFLLFSMAYILTGLLSPIVAQTGLPLVFTEKEALTARSTAVTRKFLAPQRIVWVSDSTGNYIQNAGSVLNAGNGQADLNSGRYLTLISDSVTMPGLLLDFGKEIHGGIKIITTINNHNPAGRVRVRFGESVGEAMTGIMNGGAQGSATNDHAMRDFTVTLPWLGSLEVGESGFRFVRIDLIDPGIKLEIKEISAIFTFRDIPYQGSFTCNDTLLNQIWLTSAYTVHLNMQDFLWDGIKRDRLVWVGDLHPEVMTVNAVFGYNEVVPKSLDLVRDLTPLPGWMNGISSYSMWWVIIQRDWYLHHGHLTYLQEQEDYLKALLKNLSTKIDDSGKELLDGNRFLDWPSSGNPEAVHAGLQAMMVMAFEAGAYLLEVLGDRAFADFCRETSGKLKKHVPGPGKSKQASALLSLSGLVTAGEANSTVLARDGAHGMSTFYGYYMINARAKAGDYLGALGNIREYWGGMLKLGATTFWEDFDIDWLENAARIDEMPFNGKIDVHATYGDYCYKGYRHSLCHGWASGPAPWLTEHVLGVKVLEPGCNKISIEPNLGDLEWAEGTFPTPHGIIFIRHEKNKNGKIKTKVTAPKGVKIDHRGTSPSQER